MIMERVCFYVFGFPPDYSGATVQAIYTADYLKKLGISSFFITYTYSPDNLPLNEYKGYKVVRFLREPTTALFKYHMDLLRQLYIHRREFTVLYINGNDGQFWTVFWAAIFSILFGKKIFMELNMEFPDDPLYIKGTRLEGVKTFIAKRVTGFISNSNAITKAFKREHPYLCQIETVFGAVDVGLFRKEEDPGRRLALRDALSLPRNTPIAMTCGEIVRRKGIDFLLDCWQEIVKRYKGNCLLVLVGPYMNVKESEGSSRDFVEIVLQRINSEPLKGTVRLAGQVSNVHEYMKASDLFLFAGRQEGSPNVIREAMATSLPIVSLNLPDITEDMIDNNKSGIIVYPADYENIRNWQTEAIKGDRVRQDFTDAALKLMNDPALAEAMGRNARKKAEEVFSFGIKADKYKELFEKA
jgi:glycosyltransferase involved in cell wall biosynthesis